MADENSDGSESPISNQNKNPLQGENSIHGFLYLHPSENPATPLVSPVLDSTNYHSWSRSVLTALSAKNKVEFVNGTAPRPSETDSSFSSWTRCNNMVASWLVHSVSVHIRQSIIWMDKALDVWNDLKARFSQGDLSRISDLQMEASSLNPGDLSVTDYFTKLRIIWDELDNFRPDPIYSCNEPSVIIQRKREDQAMQFLRGLNDQYNNIKAHILLMEPVPAITKFFSLVIQQERQFNNSVLVANVKNVTPITSVNHTSTNTITCTFCGKLGYSESVCFKKNGFPNQDNRGSKFGSNKKVYTYCNKIGHTVDVYYKKHGYPPGYRSQYGKSSQSNNVSTTIQEENFGNQDQNKQNNGGYFRITQHQYQILSELLKNVNSSNNQV